MQNSDRPVAREKIQAQTGKVTIGTEEERQAALPLAQKIALVTGASRGIGRAIALELAKAGAQVALNYRTGADEAREVAEEIAAMGGQATVAAADVSEPGAARDLVRKVVEQYGRVDILVNNAGITRDRSLRKLTDEDWLAVINTNLNSVFYCTSAVVPGMIEQHYGRIINISSLIGQSGAIGQANYAAAKGGIIAFTKATALELARYNITVNAIAPGYTSTDMFANVSQDIQDQIKERIPLRRFAQPVEIARAARFLAAEGDYITGQQFNVNGGIYM